MAKQIAELINGALAGNKDDINEWVQRSKKRDSFTNEDIEIAQAAFAATEQTPNLFFLQAMWHQHHVIEDASDKEARKLFNDALNGGAAGLEIGEHAFEVGKFFFNQGSKAHANFYFDKACENGYVPAIHIRAEILRNGLDFQKNIPGAIKIFEKGESQGDLESIKALARIYQSEPGFQDARLAFEYHKKAAVLSKDNNQLEAFKKDYLKQAKTHPQLKNLCEKIEQFNTVGIDLMKSSKAKVHAEGKKFVATYISLSNQLDNFLLDSLSKQHTKEDEAALKKIMHETVHAEDKEIKINRPIWKSVAANFGIACTGVGLLAIIGKAIKHIADDKPFSIRDAVFYARTDKSAAQRDADKTIDDTDLNSDFSKGP